MTTTNTMTTTTTIGTATIETNNGVSHAILACGTSFPIDPNREGSLALRSIYDDRYMSHNEVGVTGGWVRGGFSGNAY